MGKKDECWKYNEEFPGRTKYQTKCMFCNEKITSGGIYRLKFHIAAIPGHDVTVGTHQTPEAKRTCLMALEKIEKDKANRKMQVEGLRGIGSHVPASAAASTSLSASASASVGCVGEGSSRPPFYPSSSARASASASASRSHTETESHTNLLQPRVRKNRMDSYFVPCTTPGSQPTLEGMGLNKEIHDAARKEICKFLYFCNIPFIAARAPYWQNMIDAVAICGPRFKSPIEAELSGYLLDEMVEDMRVDLKENRKEWIAKGCTIMTDGWTDRRNRTLLNFLVSCGGYTMFIKSIDASAHVKNATYLCEAIEEVIAEVGEQNVIQVVTDNATNYVDAGKLLMERHPTIFWSPCAAHCIDLMLEEIGKLEFVKSCVERAKNICKFIYNHAFVLSTMRKYTGGKELARPGITRFASNFITLQSLLTSRDGLRSMFVGQEWICSSYATTTVGLDVADCIFDEDGFWKPAREILKVEGAAKQGGRGPSIWDVFSHTPGRILDGKNGDIAVDQYHRYKEDVDLIAKLGFKVYRFSISWSRIFPDGFGAEVNQEGISYYNKLIDALLEKGIQPSVTLYHWDLPQKLHESIAGWLNWEIVNYFKNYAETCFSAFGDRVKHWITFNEPLQTAVNGYATGIFAPGRCSDRSMSHVGDSSTEPYLAAHHQLLAHAVSVDVYRKKFQGIQGGIIGITVDGEGAEPFTDTEDDKAAAQRRLEFQLGWFLDPLYFGDYPAIMREKLGDRLPQFTASEVSLLCGSVDFVGLNHYTTRYVTPPMEKSEEIGYYNDQDVHRIAEWEGRAIGERAASEWLYIVPWGLRKVLMWLTERYKRPPIYVTENGMDDDDSQITSLEEGLCDTKRVNYFKGYLASVAAAIREGADVRGYYAWSLVDNFEWAQGYTKRFGLVFVDYQNDLKRHPKSSALWFADFLQERKT